MGNNYLSASPILENMYVISMCGHPKHGVILCNGAPFLLHPELSHYVFFLHQPPISKANHTRSILWHHPCCLRVRLLLLIATGGPGALGRLAVLAGLNAAHTHHLRGA